MRSNLSDAGFSTLIGVTAKIEVQDARRLFLERVEAALPATGKISSEKLAEAINSALQSFRPGQYVLAPDGWRERRKPQTLKEAADSYLATLRDEHEPFMDRGLKAWPPLRPPFQREPVHLDASELAAAEPYTRELRTPVHIEIAESKPVTQLELVEPDAKPAEPMLTDRVEAVSLDESEYSVELRRPDEEEPDEHDERARSIYGDALEVLRKKGGKRNGLGKMKSFF